MRAPPSGPPNWTRDPLLYVGALVTIAAHGWMFFAGTYLPYIDWSNHLGLISILAHGADTGALAYAERSFWPTPYFGFYMLTAAFAQLTSVPAAAKISLLVASGLMPFGAAHLAEATGRSPRLGLIAPLALFGYFLGYGFGSFVFSLPFGLFALGQLEVLLGRLEAQAPIRRATGGLAVALLAVYLAHALMFLFVAVLVAVRIGVLLVLRPRPGLRAVAAVAGAYGPAALLALPTLLWLKPWAEAGEQVADRWMTFAPRTTTVLSLGSHLLERGSADHWLTMKAAFAFLLLLLAASAVWPLRTTRGRGGLELYAAVAWALYLFGPESLERPMQVWMIYPRYATLAALFLFLLPRVDLSGRRAAVAALALGLVVHNAAVHRGTIVRFNGWAAGYDGVRRHIPRGARVLALTVAPPGDLATYHPALGSLYFYHLADGAAYTAFLFDTPLHPVRPKKTGRPRAPFWRSVHAFDPKVHGADFDYLVLRGPTLVRRTEAAGLHERVADESGWTIYRTRTPTPQRRY